MKFPPEIFWLDPQGAVVEGIGHLTMLQNDPERFGLAGSPQTPAEIDGAIRLVLESEWVRGRYSLADRSWYFQIARPGGNVVGNIHALVLEFADHADEIIVEMPWPRWIVLEISVKDFIDQKFPSAWGLNPRKTKRRQK